MPTEPEIQAAVKALYARREQTRTALVPWPSIEEEVEIVLEEAEKARAENPSST